MTVFAPLAGFLLAAGLLVLTPGLDMALLALSGTLYTILQYAGAAYLLWLGRFC